MVTRRTVLLLVVVGGAGLAALGAARQRPAPAACSTRALAGAYGFSFSGTNVRTGSYAIVGRFVADGKGRYEGAAAQSVSGRVFRNTISGSYTVLADCTGTSSLEFKGAPAAVNLSFVIVSGGEEVLLMSTDSGTIETGVAKRVAAPR